MKVYIAVNGIGLGHIKRCEVIANKLEEKGHQVTFSSYLDGFKYAKQKGFNVLKRRSLSYIVDKKGNVDYKETLRLNGWSLGFMRFLWQIVEEIRHLKIEKTGIVISDSRASTLLAAKLLGLPIILLINQIRVEMPEDKRTSKSRIKPFYFILKGAWLILKHIIEYIWGLSDLILIPDFPPPHTISKYNLGGGIPSKRKIRFIGPLVEMKLRGPSRLTLMKKFHFAKDKTLVYAAVSGPRIERKILSLKLRKIIPHFSKFQFIITEGESTKPSEMEKVDGHLIFSWIEDKLQYSLIKECDIIVCRAGHGIVTKAIIFGKPMVVIPIPGHTEQINNAKRVQELGYGEVIEQEQLNIENLKRSLQEICSSNRNTKDSYPTLTVDPIEKAFKLIQELAETREITVKHLPPLFATPVRS